jgi:hypothetical protein
MQTEIKHSKYNMTLCVDPCFRVYNRKLHMWRLSGTMLGKVELLLLYHYFTGNFLIYGISWLRGCELNGRDDKLIHF